MRVTRTLAALLLAPIALAACEGNGEAAIEQAEADLTVETPDVQPVMSAGTVSLAIDTLAGVGAYITDAEGRALYMFTADTAGASTCYGDCAVAWPPLAATEARPVGQGVQAELIGTTDRRDGGVQVTYGGWPLYYYERDAGAGTATGQDVHGFGGEWYLVRPDGEILESEEHESSG